jgi:alpha-L-fucosidase
MKQHGDSIYGTRGGPFRPGRWGVSTCKDDAIFVHVLRWPGEGPINLPALPKKIVASRLLGGGQVDATQTDAGIIITVPAADRQQLDTVVELKLDGSAVDIPIVGKR